jgi:two-component sensor histidine kinase
MDSGRGMALRIPLMKIDVHDPASPQAFLTAPDALQEGLRLGGGGIWRWRIDSEVLEWTRNLESVHQLPPGSFDGTLASFQRDIHPEDAPGVWDKIRGCIQTGEAYRAVYRAAPRPGVPETWIEASGGATTDAEGRRYLTGICLDVSERVRNERQLERRLAQQDAVARFGSFALNEGSFQKILEEAVRVAAEVLQVPLTKILEFTESAESLVLRAGIGWAEGLVGRAEVGIEQASQAGYTLLAQAPVIVDDLQTETRFSGPQLLHDHQVRSGISVVIPGSTSRPFGVFGIHARELRGFDSTDAGFLQSLANIVAGAARQVAATEHQNLLLREMAHRVGNLLQLVSSIAAQTFNAAPDIEVARRSFSARLSALARSNYAVSRGGWALTRFPDLFEEALKPFGDRIVGTGRDVLLPPQLCFDMGLVLHELATNSVKYGGLGRPDGKVNVTWSYGRHPDGARLFRFVWEDPVTGEGAGTTGSGFGSKMISALIEVKWAGTVTLGDGPGFRITLEVPVADLPAPDSP